MTETQEMKRLAKKALGGFNCPKSYRDLPMSQEALTFVTLPNGKVIKLFGFAHERQTAMATRKHLRDIAPVTVAHVVVERGAHVVIETRATFIDNERGISRRSI